MGVALAVLGVYLVAFPATVLFIIHRNSHREEQDLKLSSVAFLVRGLRPGAYWFRTVSLLSSVGIVLQAELIVDNTIRLLCLGSHMLTSVVVIAVVWPFKSTPNNIFQLCVGIACTIQLILFLASAQIEGSNSDQSSVSRNVLIALVVFVVVALAVYRF